MTTAPSHAGGLPIAASLTILVTVAVSMAFFAALAIVILLPPRPPDVMRADQVISSFTEAYGAAKSGKSPTDTETLRFTQQQDAPTSPPLRRPNPMEYHLAAILGLSPKDVHLAAREERREGFVFRVQRSEHRIDITRDGSQRETRIVTVAPHPDDPAKMVVSERPFPAPPAPPLPNAAAAPPEPPPPMFAPAPPGVLLVSGFVVSAKLPTGAWLTMAQARNEEVAWIIRAASAFAATLALLGLASWLTARRLAQTIQSFSGAVKSVGVNPHHDPVAVTGPREVREAAQAVNAMQERLRRLISDRTKTLATVAHDMRTPLMRMRLTTEAASPEVREKLSKDIADVEALVSSFIAFAREDPVEEGRQRLDLSALLESLVHDQCASGSTATFEGPDRVVITGQPLGLKRVFDNLIDNAVKYGGQARVSLRQENEWVMVDVSDRGPGVAVPLRDEIFKPFARANHDTSGAGLGLSAARAIARAHGGDVVLRDSDVGAVFRVTLPS